MLNQLTSCFGTSLRLLLRFSLAHCIAMPKPTTSAQSCCMEASRAASLAAAAGLREAARPLWSSEALARAATAVILAPMLVALVLVAVSPLRAHLPSLLELLLVDVVSRADLSNKCCIVKSFDNTSQRYAVSVDATGESVRVLEKIIRVASWSPSWHWIISRSVGHAVSLHAVYLRAPCLRAGGHYGRQDVAIPALYHNT